MDGRKGSGWLQSVSGLAPLPAVRATFSLAARCRGTRTGTAEWGGVLDGVGCGGVGVGGVGSPRTPTPSSPPVNHRAPETSQRGWEGTSVRSSILKPPPPPHPTQPPHTHTHTLRPPPPPPTGQVPKIQGGGGHPPSSLHPQWRTHFTFARTNQHCRLFPPLHLNAVSAQAGAPQTVTRTGAANEAGWWFGGKQTCAKKTTISKIIIIKMMMMLISANSVET